MFKTRKHAHRNFALLLMLALLTSFSFFLTSPVAAQSTSGGTCAIGQDQLGGQGDFALAGLGDFALAGLGDFALAGLGDFAVAGLGDFAVAGLGLEDIDVAQILEPGNIVTPEWLTSRFLSPVGGEIVVGTDTVALYIIDNFEAASDTSFSHGELVEIVTQDLIADAQDYWINVLGNSPFDWPNIKIVRVDISNGTGDYTLTGLEQRINAAVQQEIELGIEFHVLNMSFGLVPCFADLDGDGINDWDFGDFLSEREEAAGPQSVKPVLECVRWVYNNDDDYDINDRNDGYGDDGGMLEAFFGYQNLNDESVTIAVGDNNRFSPNPQDRDQVEVFAPGRQTNVFNVFFDVEETLVWTLTGPDGKTRTSTASFNSLETNPCNFEGDPFGTSNVSPVLECVAEIGDGFYEARFGYNNPDSQTVKRPIGGSNKFNRESQDQGQPEYFVPGRVRNAFQVQFSGSNLVWTLNGKTSTAGLGLNTCSDPLPELNDFGMDDYFANQFPNLTIAEVNKLITDVLESVDENELAGLQALLQGYNQLSANDGAAEVIVSVASSGNDRHIVYANTPGVTGPPPPPVDPLKPAFFPEVIATGGTLGNFGGIAEFSRDANTVAPGAFFEIFPDTYATGTSFAGPYQAVEVAMWLSNGKGTCVFQEQSNGDVWAPLEPQYPADQFLNIPATLSPLNCSVDGNGGGDNQQPLFRISGKEYTDVTFEMNIPEGRQVVKNFWVKDPDGDEVTVMTNVGELIYKNSNKNRGDRYQLRFTGENGPDEFEVIVTADDGKGGISTITYDVTVKNRKPRAKLVVEPEGKIYVGQPVTVSLVEPFDRSSVDLANLVYSFDCARRDDSFPPTPGASLPDGGASTTCTYSEPGKYRIFVTVSDDASSRRYKRVIRVHEAPVADVCYANSVVEDSYAPGTRKDGKPVKDARMITDNALGAPQNDDTFNFLTLGFGGSVVMDFSPNTIQNVDGEDLRVWETTFSEGGKPFSSYPETARIFASQNGESWVEIGDVTMRDQSFDLGELPWARYIKIVDTSNPDDFSRNADDGFDVDAVEGFACNFHPGNENGDGGGFRGADIIPLPEVPGNPGEARGVDGMIPLPEVPDTESR